MLHILIADDHSIMRLGVRALVEEHPGWEVCGEAANGREAVEMAERLRPEICIVDVSMPELNGIETTRRIRAVLPGTEVVVLTVHDSEDLAASVLAAGARGPHALLHPQGGGLRRRSARARQASGAGRARAAHAART